MTRILTNSPRYAKFRTGGAVLTQGTNSLPFALIKEIVFRDVYGLRKAGDPRIIVDVGANIGVFAVYAAGLYPNSTVYAVEPDPSNVVRLNQNIRASNLTRSIEVIQDAVDKGFGEREFHASTVDVNSSFYKSEAKTAATILVHTIPLSHFGHIDFIKVDAEGAEYDMFDDIPHCKNIAIEVHDIEGKDKKAFIERLKEVYDADVLDDIIWHFNIKDEHLKRPAVDEAFSVVTCLACP